MGRSRGVREERTEHTKLFPRTFAGSGLTGHQKVHVSTFDGKMKLQFNRNGLQNPPFCPGSSHNTFVCSLIFQNQIFQTCFCFNGNLKVWQRRASENNRDLSSQKCFNFRGVLIRDKQFAKQILGNWRFRLGTLAPGSQAWGTGLLRLGEPADGNWGNPGAPSSLPAL